jgi:hypothetical protein
MGFIGAVSYASISATSPGGTGGTLAVGSRELRDHRGLSIHGRQ